MISNRLLDLVGFGIGPEIIHFWVLYKISNQIKLNNITVARRKCAAAVWKKQLNWYWVQRTYSDFVDKNHTNVLINQKLNHGELVMG
jgi:hypothetical protein